MRRGSKFSIHLCVFKIPFAPGTIGAHAASRDLVCRSRVQPTMVPPNSARNPRSRDPGISFEREAAALSASATKPHSRSSATKSASSQSHHSLAVANARRDGNVQLKTLFLPHVRVRVGQESSISNRQDGRPTDILLLRDLARLQH